MKLLGLSLSLLKYFFFFAFSQVVRNVEIIINSEDKMSKEFNPFEPASALESSKAELEEETKKEYLKSEQICLKYSITLEYLRDIKYLLGIKKLAKWDPSEYGRDEKIFVDHSRDIQTTDEKGNPIENSYYCLDTKSKRKRKESGMVKEESQDISILPEHEIYFKIQLSLGNNDLFFTHTTRDHKFNNLLKETITFPIQINELPIHSAVSIALYDFNKEEDDGLIGSTCFYVFDKKRRLRQGVQNLVIHKNIQPDLSYKFSTPGFPDKNTEARDINVTLNKMGLDVATDDRTPILLQNKLHDLYLKSD